MATEPKLELELLDERPQQFGLVHVVGLITVFFLVELKQYLLKHHGEDAS